MTDQSAFCDTAGLLDRHNAGRPHGIRFQTHPSHHYPSHESASGSGSALTPRIRDKTPVWFKSSPLVMALTRPDKSVPWMSSATRRLGLRKLGLKKSEISSSPKPDDRSASNQVCHPRSRLQITFSNRVNSLKQSFHLVSTLSTLPTGLSQVATAHKTNHCRVCQSSTSTTIHLLSEDLSLTVSNVPSAVPSPHARVVHPTKKIGLRCLPSQSVRAIPSMQPPPPSRV